MYQVAYSPGAIEDYEKSILWYAERSQQAVEYFIAEVQDKLDVIRQKPKQFINKYRHFYETNLNKYPFTIIYTIEEPLEQIFIVSIYHQKRNPKRKYRR